MWVRCVVVVVLVGVCWRGAAGEQVEERVQEDDPVGCGPALTFLVERGVAEKTHLERLPGGDAGKGPGSEVCGGGACCLPEVTEALLAEGKRSLSQVVSDTAGNMMGVLTTQRQAFNSAVESALSSSERRAVRVLETRYPRVAGAAQPVLRQLYAGLRAGLTQADERPLKRSLAAFWDDLFPPVYHSVLHTLPLPFTERYSQCLREARRTVRPWGPIPTLVGEPLLRGLHSARLLLHALDMGAFVLHSARSLPIGPECSEAAARMELCGACHGSMLPPCHGLCLNVARGCLAPLAEVDGAWADLAGAVTRVQESLQVVRLAHLLHQLPDKVSEAIMLAMEHGPRILKKVGDEWRLGREEEGAW
ncbi:glypican-5-like [Eriocheir sinensis]|uniref:glypican-5-like n=1 Tax=Eriocheir sinensis TaxID=95602 RepID=UPI0021CA949E|nr:glypican-5-like [Eriocheir sinensis]